MLIQGLILKTFVQFVTNGVLFPMFGETKDEYLIDDLLYKQRFIIERTNAWIDSFISPLNKT